MLAREQQNIGDRACRRFLQLGVLSAGVALAVWLFAAEGSASRFGWFLALPVALSSYFLMSGTRGVCAYQSFVGRRVADHGSEVILDHDTLKRMRLRALLALAVSVVVGGLVASLFVASA